MDKDDDLVLSTATQSALLEFLAEKQSQESKFEIESPEDPSIDDFAEDWQVLPPCLQAI
jgi:hypothetical protein